MATLPVFGLLLTLADAVTRWPGFHWAGLALTIASQCLAAWTWWKARHQPLTVLYGCLYRCGFVGDRLACEAHVERCQAQRWAA